MMCPEMWQLEVLFSVLWFKKASLIRCLEQTCADSHVTSEGKASKGRRSKHKACEHI